MLWKSTLARQIGNGNDSCIHDYDRVNRLIRGIHCLVAWLRGCCSLHDYFLFVIRIRFSSFSDNKMSKTLFETRVNEKKNFGATKKTDDAFTTKSYMKNKVDVSTDFNYILFTFIIFFSNFPIIKRWLYMNLNQLDLLFSKVNCVNYKDFVKISYSNDSFSIAESWCTSSCRCFCEKRCSTYSI